MAAISTRLRRANVIGSGPNGLAAAITLAQAGVRVIVYERNKHIGGACSTAELTLPGFQHDLGASAFPMGVASPFFRSLPLARYGFQWIEPDLPLAHPLENGDAVSLLHSIDAMTEELGAPDGAAWERLIGPFVRSWGDLVAEILGPVLHVPRHPLLLARFGASAVLSATVLARSRFKGERARALFAALAAHSVMPLTAHFTSAVALVLAAAGHTRGWPMSAGGAQSLTDALAAHLRSLGGEVQTGNRVARMQDMEPADAIFFAASTRSLDEIAGGRLSNSYRASLRRFRRGPGVFKVDWALSQPIPWQAEACRRAGTVHVGGTFAEIVAAEQAVSDGGHPERPFVLLVQQSVCDPSRAPQGQHTAWGYCHVPNRSHVDQTEAIEAQVERFAPGFRDCVLARKTHSTAQLEAWNSNLLGGDVSGGMMSGGQLIARPSLRGYATSDPRIFLCSASTPPGGGVHGMCGFHAASLALRRL